SRRKPDRRSRASCSTPRWASAASSIRPPRPTCRAAARTSARPWASGAGASRATSSCRCSGRAPCATCSAWSATPRCRRCARSRRTPCACSRRACSWWTCARSCSRWTACARARPTPTRWGAMPGCSAATTRAPATRWPTTSPCRTTCARTSTTRRCRWTRCRCCPAGTRVLREPPWRRAPPVAARAPLLQVVAEEVRRLLPRERFDLAQLALDRARAHPGLLDLVAGLGELLLHRVQHVAELGKLGLDRAERAPDLARALLDRERAEAHLEAGHQRQQRGRAGHRDAAVALQAVHQPGAPQHFRVQALGGQEQDRELGGVRRGHVLVADAPRLLADAPLERLAGGTRGVQVGRFLRGQQALVVLDRELGVDR